MLVAEVPDRARGVGSPDSSTASVTVGEAGGFRNCLDCLCSTEPHLWIFHMPQQVGTWTIPHQLDMPFPHRGHGGTFSQALLPPDPAQAALADTCIAQDGAEWEDTAAWQSEDGESSCSRVSLGVKVGAGEESPSWGREGEQWGRAGPGSLLPRGNCLLQLWAETSKLHRSNP